MQLGIPVDRRWYINNMFPHSYKHKIDIRIPAWAATLYIVVSLIMIPWTIYLGFHLPSKRVNHHYDISWVGLDAGLAISLLLTGIMAWRRRAFLIITAAITGTLFLCDAWFDIVSANPGTFAFAEALFMAAFAEVPLACMSYILAGHTLKRLTAAKIES